VLGFGRVGEWVGDDWFNAELLKLKEDVRHAAIA